MDVGCYTWYQSIRLPEQIKKILEKYFFSKVFLEEVLSKKKNMLFKESFYEKHNPK